MTFSFLLDEARNEVDLFLRLRDGEAYAQGLTNPSQERNAEFTPRQTMRGKMVLYAYLHALAKEKGR